MNPSSSSSLKIAPAFLRFQQPWTIFWAAFLIRVLYMTLAHTYRLRLDEDHFQFGWEMGRIARALVTGHGYGDPFYGHTGPTAWVAPLYPLLLAGVFKVFGVYTLRSAWVILTINSFFSALTVLAIYEIAFRCFNRRIALWSAWVWAVHPAAMQYAVRWVWEMTLSTWLFSCILVCALRMRGVGQSPFRPSRKAVLQSPARDQRTLSKWLVFGALWGMLALSNPSLLLFLPAAALWIIHGSRNVKTQLGYATASAILFCLCVSPWVARNAIVFHHFIPTRTNLGTEIYLGNGPGARGFLMEYNHPDLAPDQFALYRKMGEFAYAQMRGRLGRNFIAANPGLFLRNSIKRVYFFWISVPRPSNEAWYIEAGRVANFAFAGIAGLLGLALALKRRVPAAWMFAWAFLFVPLLYYFIAVHARFRNPLEPLIAILAVYLFQSAEKSFPRREVRISEP